jgi:hypothetical protein
MLESKKVKGQVHIKPSANAIDLWSCKGIPLTLF